MAHDAFDALTCLLMNPVKQNWDEASNVRMSYHLHHIIGFKTNICCIMDPDPTLKSDGRTTKSLRTACDVMQRSQRFIKIMPITIMREEQHQLMLIVRNNIGYLFDPHGDDHPSIRHAAQEISAHAGIIVTHRVCKSSVGPQEVEERAGVRGMRHGSGHCAAWCLLLVHMLTKSSSLQTQETPNGVVRAMLYDRDGSRRTPMQMKRAIAAYTQRLMMDERNERLTVDTTWIRNIYS